MSGKPYSFTTKEGHVFSGIDGQMHSVDDAPAVIYADGTKWWYKNNQVHRDGGPAVVWGNGVEEWWQNGMRHRTDGPAQIYPNMPAITPRLRGVKEWWLKGRLIRREK